jgi:GT2 family glycosyltransferase
VSAHLSGRFAAAFEVPQPAQPVAPAERTPTFAIVIAAYQAEATIAEAVESALAQTCSPDEIVVCDDGSTDGTGAILASYGDRITLIRQENRGEGAARNAAIRAAHSDFVVFLDADDTFLPGRIEAIAELATLRPDIDVVSTDVVAELDGVPLERESDIVRFPADAESQRAEILRHSYLTCPAVRRERLLAIGGFDDTLPSGSEDWDCWIRLIRGGMLAALVNEPLYVYRLRDDSLTGDPARARHMRLAVLEKHRADPSLSAQERAVIDEGIRLHSRDATLIEARQAILRRSPDARRLALRIVAGRSFSLPSRLKAVLSLVAPGLSRRFLVRRIEASPTGGVSLRDR